MRSGFKWMAACLGACLSWVVPSGFPLLFRALLAHLYTGFLKRRFRTFGKDSLLAYRALHLRGLQFVSVGEGTQFSSHLTLTAWAGVLDVQDPEIVIGDGCVIREGCHITAIRSIRIGDNLLTGTNVLITDNSHGCGVRAELDTHPSARPLYSKGPVRIGNNVWLGNNVCVMPGVTIGNGAVIGAGSVVTRDVPPYTLAAGVPARVIRSLG